MEGIFLLILFAMLVFFNIATWLWGFDSTDGVDSPEWERRRNWKAFH
jgi:hypothetical protein